MAKSNNRLISLALISFYILWKTPFVALYMSTYLSMLLLFGWAILLIFSKREHLGVVPATYTFYIIYIFLDLIIIYRSGAGALGTIWSVFLDILPFLAGHIIISNNQIKDVELSVKLIILTYAITAVTTYIGYSTFPNASRILAADSTAYLTYYRYNIGGFDFIYSIVLIHPLVVGYFKGKKRLHFSIVYTIVTAFCVFSSNYTTASLLLILSCLAYFIPFTSDRKLGKKRIRFMVFFIVISIGFVPEILRYAASVRILGGSSDKIVDIANLLQGRSTNVADTYIRQAKYQMSLETFFRYPITGAMLIGDLRTGGHSFWFDFLARYGIIGGIIVIGFYWSCIKRYIMLSRRTSIIYYALLSFILTVILSILNPGLWIFELTFAIPVFLYSMTNYNTDLETMET